MTTNFSNLANTANCKDSCEFLSDTFEQVRYQNSLHWQTGTVDWADGAMGFTLYNYLNKVIYTRSASKTIRYQQDTVYTQEPIGKIVFAGTSDGYHGQFSVTDFNGLNVPLNCRNCLVNSPTTLLQNVYIDEDMNGDKWVSKNRYQKIK